MSQRHPPDEQAEPADDQQSQTQSPASGPRIDARGPSRQGSNWGFGSEAAALVQVLNDYDLPADVERLVRAEFNPDHILSNLNDGEVRYRRFALWNNKEMVMGAFPPRQSIWQGDVRGDVEAIGDSGRSALTVEQVQAIRDAFDAAFARVARSRDGWQQDKLADQTEERRIVEERQQESQSLLSRIMG